MARAGGVAGSRRESRYELPAVMDSRELAASACIAAGSLPGSACVWNDTAVATVLEAAQARVLASAVCWSVAAGGPAVVSGSERTNDQAANPTATREMARAMTVMWRDQLGAVRISAGGASVAVGASDITWRDMLSVYTYSEFAHAK